MKRSVTSVGLVALVSGTAVGVAEPVDLYVPTILNSVSHWTSGGPIDGLRAYSIGYYICNAGDSPSFWQASTPEHPVTTSNLYVVRDGMIRQLGMSWAFNEFFPLQQACPVCEPGPGGSLGSGCQTSNTGGLAGYQPQLRRRSSVNPWTGDFPFPGDTSGDEGVIGRRLQVSDADLEVGYPNYFIEVQVVAHDEVSDSAKLFNASHRRVTFIGPQKTLQPQGDTMDDAAIYAWGAVEGNAALRIERIDFPGDGVVYVASKAKNIGAGAWRYTYAVQNVNCDRAIDWFSVLMGADGDPDNVQFHDVDYHSGEVFDNTDWVIHEGDATLFWFSPQSYDENPNTNALRWGTMYTFQFDSSSLPHEGVVTLSLFKPGSPDAVEAPATVPSYVFCPTDINGDHTTGFADLNLLLGDYGEVGPEQATDVDGDGETGFGDLNQLLGAFGQSC